MIDTIQVMIDKSLAEEQEAIANYLSRADQTFKTHPTISALFKELARDEEVHAAQLLKAKEILGFTNSEVEQEGAKEAEEILTQEPDIIQLIDEVQ